MPDATELFALADLKTILAITSTGEDARLTLIKDAVEAWAKRYCGRDFLVTTYTEYQDGDDSQSVRLDQRPIISITSINSDPARLFTDASLIPSSDFILDPKAQRLGFIELLTYKFLRGFKSTKIVYQAGYSVIPTDLSMALKMIAAKQFKIISKQMFAERSQQIGDLTITLSPDEFPKDALATVRSFRRMSA